jgi:hypothetical protein
MKQNYNVKIGLTMITLALIFLILYTWLLFFTKWSFIIMQLTSLFLVIALVSIVIWIGRIMMREKMVGTDIDNSE